MPDDYHEIDMPECSGAHQSEECDRARAGGDLRPARPQEARGGGPGLTKEADPRVQEEPLQTLLALPEQVRKRLERLAAWRARFLRATTIDQRLRLLIEFGFTDYDIAKAIPNAKARSVRRWRTERPPLTRQTERWDPVDDLCALVCFVLSDGTYDEEGVIAWMRSRQPELDNERPLDVLRTGDFDAVRAAAEQALLSVRVDPAELVPLPRRPATTRIPARDRVK